MRPKMFTKENNQRVRFLSDDEEAALRQAIGEDEWPIVAVAMHTGLRRSEQSNLRWKQVDFTTGIITVLRSKHGETRRVPMNDIVRRDPSDATEPAEKRVRLPERHRRDADRRAQLREPHLHAGPEGREDRCIQLALPRFSAW